MDFLTLRKQTQATQSPVEKILQHGHVNTKKSYVHNFAIFDSETACRSFLGNGCSHNYQKLFGKTSLKRQSYQNRFLYSFCNNQDIFQKCLCWSVSVNDTHKEKCVI